MTWVPKETHIEKMKEEIDRQREIMRECMKVFGYTKTGSAEYMKARRDFDHANKTIKRLEEHIKELRDE